MRAALRIRSPLPRGRNSYNPRLLMIDNFVLVGTVPDPFWWVETDTEGKISEDGTNLVFSGGKATPSWTDPAVVSKAPHMWARVPGLIIEWQVAKPGIGTEFALGLTDGALTGGTGLPGEPHYFDIADAAGVVYVGITGSRPSSPLAVGIAKAWYRIVCLRQAVGTVKGAAYYVSTVSRYGPYAIIWVDRTVTTTPLYAFFENYNAVAMIVDAPSVYYGANPQPIVSSPVTTLTPTLLAELLVDGDMELAGVANWADDGTPTTKAKDVVQFHGGAQSLRLVMDAAAEGALQSSGSTAGKWCQVSVWVKRVSGVLILTHGADYSAVSEGTSWAQIKFNRRATGNHNFRMNSSGGAAEAYWDDASTKNFVLSSLHGANQPAVKQGIFDRTVYCAAQCQEGFWLNWDGNDNGTEDAVEALVDRSNSGTVARLSKYVNGVVTNNLISAAITYSAGAILRVVRVGTSYALYYNNLQVGTTQTISDAGITNNTGFCRFGNDETAANAADILTCDSGIGVA